jgi:hypothetical protein
MYISPHSITPFVPLFPGLTACDQRHDILYPWRYSRGHRGTDWMRKIIAHPGNEQATGDESDVNTRLPLSCPTIFIYVLLITSGPLSTDGALRRIFVH